MTKKMMSMLREMLKSRTIKMRNKTKMEMDVRVVKEAESSPKDKKKTRKEKVMVTILVDPTSLKEEGRNKKYSFISQNDFLAELGIKFWVKSHKITKVSSATWRFQGIEAPDWLI